MGTRYKFGVRSFEQMGHLLALYATEPTIGFGLPRTTLLAATEGLRLPVLVVDWASDMLAFGELIGVWDSILGDGTGSGVIPI